MRALGILDKMKTLYINPVQYFLELGNDKVAVNELIGKGIQSVVAKELIQRSVEAVGSTLGDHVDQSTTSTATVR